MPDGHVSWYDTSQDKGVVEHNGREYAVDGPDIDNRAKRAGMPVHFDIQRTPHGDVATAVRARPGSRTGHTAKRTGDLAGAHHPSEKGQDEWDALSLDRRAYGQQPRRLAEDWVAFLSTGQVDRAVQLYAPDAQIIVGDRRISGGDDVRRWLERSALFGADAARADVSGEGGGATFAVTWRPMAGDDAALHTTLVVQDGAIQEQRTAEG